MNKLFIPGIIVLLISIPLYAETSSSSINWISTAFYYQDACRQNHACNVSLLNAINATITNYNGTNLYLSGWLNASDIRIRNDLYAVGDISGNDITSRNVLYTAYLADNFGLGGWDMTGDPYWLNGVDMQMTQNLIIDNNLTAYRILGNLTPTYTLTYDIGSGVLRWRNLYITNLSADYGQFAYDLEVLGNLSADSICVDGGDCLGDIVNTYLALDKTNWDTDDWILYNDILHEFSFNESKLATTFYNCSNVSAVAGTVEGGFYEINKYDGISLNVTETAGAPGMDFRINFTGIVDFNQLIWRYKSIVGENHITKVQLWDYDDNDWETYATLSDVGAYNVKEIGVYDADEHILDGAIQMRFISESNGNTNHIHYFDWVTIADGFATPSGAEIDPYSIHTSSINESQFFYNGILNLNQSYINELYLPYTNAEYALFMGNREVQIRRANISMLSVNNSIQIGTKTVYSNLTANANGDFIVTSTGTNVIIGDSETGASTTGISGLNLIGQGAGFNTDNSGASNMFGEDAGKNALDADDDNFFGAHSGENTDSLYYANCFGSYACYDADDANSINAFGTYAAFEATNAEKSSCIGGGACSYATNAKRMSAVGHNAGTSDTVNNVASWGASNLFGYYTGTGGYSNGTTIGISIENSKPNQINLGNILQMEGQWSGELRSSDLVSGAIIQYGENHINGSGNITGGQGYFETIGNSTHRYTWTELNSSTAIPANITYTDNTILKNMSDCTLHTGWNATTKYWDTWQTGACS